MSDCELKTWPSMFRAAAMGTNPVSRKARRRRTRKQRRALHRHFNKGMPMPRHCLTGGRTGKVARLRRRTQRNEGNGS